MFALDWDLSNLMNGAAAAPQEFHLTLDKLEQDIKQFKLEIPEMFGPYQNIMDALYEAESVVCCLTGENTSNSEATQLEARVNALRADFEKVKLKLDEMLLQMPESQYEKIASSLGQSRFYLDERRKNAKQKMPLDKESLVNDLSVSGLHGLMTLYFTYMGEIEFDLEGKKLNLSKLENLFYDPDRTVRIESLRVMEEELKKRESVFAQILNNLVDFRLRSYSARGWDDYLHETLQANRTSRKTVEAMWAAIAANKEPLVRFMKAKASLLGLNSLSYADYRASIGKGDQTKITYDDAANAIIDLFSEASPKMGAFAKRAIENQWVSASISDTKRAGGFCTNLPVSKESRILMTFSDSLSSQGTLAHELGHAFHNEAMKELPAMMRTVPYNLAETASTMCEMMVHDNAIRNAKGDKEKLFLLDDQLTDYMIFNMDLHSRFLFDSAFHEARKVGFISPSEISEMMVEAQREGFAGALDDYLPHFWAYKMHFYLTDAPFYNWTYTFGYLFSLGVYAKLRDSGAFEEKYIALLQDSGSMSAEELAKKHLGVDLTRIDFWQGAIDMLNGQIEEYIRLAKDI